ncbi:MAG: M23 family metallopeptidase [Pyrinomonadaceae bacterium]
MQNRDNRYYTFLLSHTTKEKVFIRRLEISKKLVHASAASAVLGMGLVSVGVFGAIEGSNALTVFAESANSKSAIATQASLPVSEVNNRSIDYSRPQSLDKFAENAGGPTESQATVTDSSDEEKSVEARLNQIERTSRPENLPTIWAHLGKINNEFGFRRNPFGGRSYEFHAGIDIGGDRGDMVVAPANGVVIKAGWSGGYGRLIEIDHGNGLVTRYGHLSAIEVNEGDTIKRGQLIGLVGSTGRSTGPHLHYELRLGDKPVNPRRFLPPEPRQLRAN